jgi:hypothetical protein
MLVPPPLRHHMKDMTKPLNPLEPVLDPNAARPALSPAADAERNLIGRSRTNDRRATDHMPAASAVAEPPPGLEEVSLPRDWQPAGTVEPVEDLTGHMVGLLEDLLKEHQETNRILKQIIERLSPPVR